MASTKEDGIAAAAAQQVSAMSLNESSAEGKDNETENNEAPARFCSACGTKSDAVKKCTSCKCVWYCDRDCQNRHRKEHKKECKRIKKELDKRGGKLDVGTEEDIGPLAKLPPREECPICMHALPLHGNLITYSSCCGKTLCSGCDFQHQMKSRELSLPLTCAFCRTTMPKSGEEALVPLRKRVELKDPQALRTMALNYGDGLLGLPMNQTKCIELLRESADLGCPAAHYQLGNFYKFGTMGLEQNEEEAIEYWKKAAKDGHIRARHNLGVKAVGHGDFVAAMRHFRLSASVGDRLSMKSVILCFEDGFLHHANLAETVQNFYRSRAELRSEDRDKFIEHLKKTGEYKAEYEC